MSDEGRAPLLDDRRLLVAILGFGGFGLILAGGYAGSLATEAWARILVWFALLTVGFAAAAASVVPGFLFGIPRTRASAAPEQGGFDDNTNLEQISDWLTKVLVGVSLTELSVLPSKFLGLVDYVSGGMPEPKASTTIIAALIVYYGVWGFLSSYIMTRVYMRIALEQWSRAKSEARGTAVPVDA
jgi:hypothetical protein